MSGVAPVDEERFEPLEEFSRSFKSVMGLGPALEDRARDRAARRASERASLGSTSCNLTVSAKARSSLLTYSVKVIAGGVAAALRSLKEPEPARRPGQVGGSKIRCFDAMAESRER